MYDRLFSFRYIYIYIYVQICNEMLYNTIRYGVTIYNNDEDKGKNEDARFHKQKDKSVRG